MFTREFISDVPYGIPRAGTVVVASISLYARYPTVRAQIQTFQKSLFGAEKPYGSGIRNSNPRRGALERSFNSLRASCCCVYLRFPCRLQTPGQQWRYTVSIVANGKRGRDSRYHRLRTPAARAPPEHGRDGDARTEKVTILPTAGRRARALESRQLSNVQIPRERKIRHRWRPRKRPIGGQNWGHRKVHEEYHRVFGLYSNCIQLAWNATAGTFDLDPAAPTQNVSTFAQPMKNVDAAPLPRSVVPPIAAFSKTPTSPNGPSSLLG